MLKFFSQNTRKRNILLCVICGILLGLSYPPFESWFLIYFGLLIFLYLILTSSRLRQAFGRGYLALVIFNEITLYWISGWHSDDTFLKLGGLATVFLHPVFLMIPALAVYGIKKAFNKYIAIVLFPLIWVGFEYFHNQWQFTFPWLELGNSESYNINRIQYAELIGVHGISFLICIVTVLIYFIIERLYNTKWKLISVKTITVSIIIFILLLFPNYYSSTRLNEASNEKYFSNSDPSKIVSSCIVQANTDPYKKWGGNQDSLILSYFDILNKGLSSNPDLMLLHETAPPYYFFEDYNRDKTMLFIDFVNRNKKFLLMGIPHLEYYKDSLSAPNDARVNKKSGSKYDAFNSVVLLEPEKKISEYTIHKKVKLVPFSERVPYQEIFPFTEKLVNWGVGISHWQRGNDLTLFELNSSKLKVKFEGIICFESVFSELVSGGVNNGAEFIAIVTNDGWWGNTSGPYQHEQYAVLRAIENRKWVVRCAQTGVSCFIDPLGRIYDEIPYNTEGYVTKNIIANSEKTTYCINGDVIGKGGFAFFVVSLVISVLSYVKRKILSRKA